MAKVKFSALISEMRNKLNGSVFSRNRGGSYLRNKVTPLNPQTAAQTLSRGRIGQLAQAWKGLSQAARDAWNGVVENFTSTDVFGDEKVPSGFNLYVGLNKNLLDCNIARIDTAPVAATLVPSILSSLVADTTVGTLTATFAPAIDAGTSIKVFASPALSPGINNANSQLRQIHVIDSTDASPLDLAAEYVTKFGALPAVGQKVFMSFENVHEANGQSVAKITVSDIAV